MKDTIMVSRLTPELGVGVGILWFSCLKLCRLLIASPNAVHFEYVKFLGGLRVTKPTIRLACPSVRLLGGLRVTKLTIRLA